MSDKINANRKSRVLKRHDQFKDCLDFEKIFSVDNIYRASQDCRRGFNWKKPVQDFNRMPYINSKLLSEQILTGNYRPKNLKKFIIKERGKTRIIHPVSFTDRIVQKCLCNYAYSPVILPLLIHANSTSQKGKGTSFATALFEKHLRLAYQEYGRKGYLLSLDISKYFDSIPSKLACNKLIYELKKLSLDSYELKSVNRIADITRMYMLNNPGLELGNQLSQNAAIFYCNDIDHFVLEKLHLPYYGRYMDDSYVFCPSLEVAKQVQKTLNEKYALLGLTVSERKTNIEPILAEHIFLKTLFRMDGNGYIFKTLPNSTFKRYRRHLKALKRLEISGRIGSEVIQESLASFKSLAVRTTDVDKTQQIAMYWV